MDFAPMDAIHASPLLMFFDELDEAFEGERAIGLRNILTTSFVNHYRYFVLVPSLGGFGGLVEPATQVHTGLVLILDHDPRNSRYVTVAIGSGTRSDDGGETVFVQIVDRSSLECRSPSATF
jgi:hypothetical protein